MALPVNRGGAKCKWIFTLIAVLCFVAAFSGKAMAAGEKPYFVYSSDGSTITFKWGTDYASGTQLNKDGSDFPYDRNLSVTTYPEVTKIIFEPEFINYKPTALCFAGYTGLKEIEGIEYLNTENYTSFFRMFYNCSSLENLDLSSFNTAKLEYMDEMFNGCTSLKTVKLNGPNFTTSQVTKMNIMFLNCKSLETVDLSGFDTQSCEDMSAMFHRCEKLESIVFPTSMNTTKLNNIESMFRDCKSLKYLDMKGFGMMSKVNNFKNVFNGCESLVVLDISNYFAYVSYMYGIFDDCKSLTTILVRPNGFKIEYLNTTWNQNYSSTYFGNCDNLIGDKGTTFRNASYQYACVDGGESAPGYFTTGNYKIFYELDGGTNDVNNPIDFDIHLASDITIKQPTKDGYDFIGWTGTLASGLSETVPETDVKIAAGSIGNRIYTAHWAKKPKLTFDTKGGSQVHVPIVASAGSDISSEVTPIINGTNVTTKNGYDFVKWDKEIPTTMPATDLTITALWTPTVYNINLNYDGGELPTGKSNPTTFTIETETFTLEKPEKTGYTFAGWHTGKTVDPDGTITKGYYAQDLDYTATWDVNQYTITFNTDGGSAVAEITQDYNSAITAPANPTKEHYIFIGWDKAIPATMPAENISLTAQWEAIEYKITLDYAGGELPTGKSNPTTYTIETPTFTLEKPIRTGYTFAGWNTGKTVDPDGVITKGYYAQDLDYTATWDVNQYTITFNTDGGSAVAAITQDYNSAITAPANPTKEHYKFIGWDKAIPATMPAENNTLTAQWEPIEYKITLDYAGGELPSGKSNPTTYTIETPTFTLEKPIRTGYTFAGWNTGKAVDPDGIIVKGTFDDIALTATWQINQYTITFDTDGGSEISAIKQDFNTIITKPADPVKVGYTFLSWDKDIPNTMPAEDVTITAKWQINTHTITFDTDGGTPIDKMTVKYGENITKPADPVKTGYTFLGWDKQIPETMPDEDLTFKAQWQINQYTITFDTDGADPIEAITLYYNTAITAPANPAKKGFTFLGWQPALPATMPANNLTVKAQWRDDRETIAVDFNGTTSFPTDADKFCNGNETSISLPFTITKGQPSEYIVTFENGTVVNGKVDANNNVLIEIPNDLESGVYKGSVVFNGDPELYKESDAYPVTITANIPQNAALQIYSDVLLVDNHDNNYSAYQWYKDGNAISGATLQFYSEPSFNGRYTVKITDKDGKEFMSCPVKTGVSVKNTKSSVKVYPNPATSGEQFTLEIEEYDPAKDYTIMIFTANGTLVKKLTGLEKINTTTLPMGIYSGSLISNGEKSGFKVIVK